MDDFLVGKTVRVDPRRGLRILNSNRNSERNGSRALASIISYMMVMRCCLIEQGI